MTDAATVVLVHGVWHGGWCWEKVIPLLERDGVPVVAVELPFTSLHDDVRAASDALDGVDRRAVLCGHSYGGAVITNAGHHSAVEHLVYLTAFACDEGESPAQTAIDTPLPATDLGDALAFNDDGTVVSLLPEAAVKTLYHDCDATDVDAALARLRPISMSCLTTPVGPPAWRVKPSTYVVSAEDQGVHPDLQRLMAGRCTNSVEWPTAHSPFLNRPDLVASLLTGLARMKVRIGYGLGTRSLTNDADRFNAFVDALEGYGFDSLWLSERITGDCPDPLIGLAVRRRTHEEAQARHQRAGAARPQPGAARPRSGPPSTGCRTAGRCPRSASASPTRASSRRSASSAAIGPSGSTRRLPLIRRLWTEESVDHDGERFHFEAVSVRPKPIQQPPDVWLGGLAPSELRRVGRLGDGWLPSFCTPADVERSRPVVEEAAAAAGRAIDRGALGRAGRLLPTGRCRTCVSAALAARRPDLADPADGDRLRLRRPAGPARALRRAPVRRIRRRAAGRARRLGRRAGPGGRLAAAAPTRRVTIAHEGA